MLGPTVMALSSGFLMHPDDIDPAYRSLRDAIASDACTALLLPAFDLETCVATIVQRQLSRPYLRGDRASEERRIRERFSRFMALPCARFQSNAAPDEVAELLAEYVRHR